MATTEGTARTWTCKRCGHVVRARVPIRGVHCPCADEGAPTWLHSDGVQRNFPEEVSA